MSDRAAAEAVADAHRREWGLVLAATVRVVRDLDLAEECVQEAYATALREWPRTGVPAGPAAWLTTVARRRAVDALRRERALRTRLPLLVVPDDQPGSDEAASRAREAAAAEAQRRHQEATVPDERLRLVFLCCHPALAVEAQAALTLRLVCGVATPDVARAFLVPEATMAARITRAKRKVAGSRIPFRVPGPEELPARLDGVLGVVHLLLTAGHTAPSGPSLVRSDLLERSLHLARTLTELLPDQAEAEGLLALALLTDARRSTRVSAGGDLLTLGEQDRSRWDRAAVGEARDLLARAVRREGAGRYVLQGVIALAHTEAPSAEETDGPLLLALYDELLAVDPSPVVALNRAVALAAVAGPEAALAEVAALAAGGDLAGYPYLPAVEADLLARLGRPRDAALALQRALALTANDVERRHLLARLERLPEPVTPAGPEPPGGPPRRTGRRPADRPGG